MLMAFNKLLKDIYSFLKYLGYCVKCNIAQAVSNKKSFVIQAFFMFLNNFIWLGFWFILFYNSESGDINGVTLNDIIYLWSVPTISYGLCFFVFGGVEDLSYMITNKELDTVLTKPKHSLISLVTSSAKLSAMGDIMYGLILGIFAVNFNPLKYLFLLMISIVGAIGFLGICIIVNSLAFWFGDISKTSRMYINNLLLTLTIYPKEMFTGIIKILMYTLIPAMYVAHIPVALVKELTLPLLLFELIAVTLILIISIKVYEKGLQKYGK